MILYNAVAFASGRFEAYPIEDRDAPPCATNKTCPLKNAGCNRYAGALNAQHCREEFLRKRKCVRAGAIMGNQEPSTIALPEGMKPVASRGLRELIARDMDVA